MSGPPLRRWRVLARDGDTNDVRRVWRTPDGWTSHKHPPARASGLFTRAEAAKVATVMRGKGKAVYVTRRPYPFLVLDDDTRMVRQPLAQALTGIAVDLERYLWVGEGWRTHARQRQLYRQYERRGFAPPVVARPGTSNHETGWAADVSVLHSGRAGQYTNLGNWGHGVGDAMRRHGVGLVVPGEPWHAELV